MDQRPLFRCGTTVLAATAALLLGAGAALAGAGEVPGTSGAGTLSGVTEAARPAFYEPPASIPATPGTVIRSEPATSVLDPLGLSSLTTDARRVMYASRDRTGRPIAVTGLVMVPRAAWIGLGTRPVIAYAPGTQGMADRCAPSRQVSDGITEYESAFFSGLLKRGYAVALTDYQGLGTPGSHTYMVRAAQGQAVLDMARASQRLSGTGLSASSPVGISGYSQGGGAAAAAAELWTAYAPELRVKGVVAGAVPADLATVGAHLDSGFYAAFLDYALVGAATAYGIEPSSFLNDAGLGMLPAVERSCVLDLTSFAGQDSSRYTKDGQRATEWLGREPFAGVVADNRIGKRKPAAPVLVSHSALDDVIPYAVGKRLAKDWCAQGATVRFSTNLAPTHIGGMAAMQPEALAFFEARFAGLPASSTCRTL